THAPLSWRCCWKSWEKSRNAYARLPPPTPPSYTFLPSPDGAFPQPSGLRSPLARQARVGGLSCQGDLGARRGSWSCLLRQFPGDGRPTLCAGPAGGNAVCLTAGLGVYPDWYPRLFAPLERRQLRDSDPRDAHRPLDGL